FMHVYLDDIFVFSDTIEDHEHHLNEGIFNKLREQELFLKASKVELYAESMDCLGHIIDEKGLHADSDKLECIRNLDLQPHNYNDIQKFLGLVNYLSHFLPDVSAYTNPLSEMSKNGQPFFWRPLHDVCFRNIKDLCCKTPILKPIDPQNPDPIWVVCDASVSGIGAMYGQGPTWQT
ncbi:DNA/RNA polymerase, partial [Dendrothele bispora CBS 962.96]